MQVMIKAMKELFTLGTSIDPWSLEKASTNKKILTFSGHLRKPYSVKQIPTFSPNL